MIHKDIWVPQIIPNINFILKTIVLIGIWGLKYAPNRNKMLKLKVFLVGLQHLLIQFFSFLSLLLVFGGLPTSIKSIIYEIIFE